MIEKGLAVHLTNLLYNIKYQRKLYIASFFTFYAVAFLEQVEELFYFGILFAFFYEVSDCYLGGFGEKFFSKLLYFLIDYFVWNAKDFKAGTDGRIYQKFQLNQLQRLYFIEIENIK